MSTKHEMKQAVIAPRGSDCRGSGGPWGLAGFWFGIWMLVTWERSVCELLEPHARMWALPGVCATSRRIKQTTQS